MEAEIPIQRTYEQTPAQKEPTPKERVDALVERFAAGELPRSLAEIEEIARGVDAEWQEGGFMRASSYLDEDGGLILVARQGDRDAEVAKLAARDVDSYNQPSAEKKWRFLVDERVIDITVPPQQRSRSARYRSMRGSESIYDIPEGEEELSEDVQLLVDKLGRRVSQSWDQDGSATLGSGTVGLASVSREAKRRKEAAQWEKDFDEAHAIEEMGMKARKEVRKGLSAKKYAAHQDEAYRAGLQHGENVQALKNRFFRRSILKKTTTIRTSGRRHSWLICV